jgi:hypothetical protein
VKISGAVEKVAGKSVFLKNSEGLKVELRVTTPPKGGGKFAATATGKFKEFANKTVVIECEHAEFKQIIGDGK